MQKQEKRQRINAIDPRNPYIYILTTQDTEKLLKRKLTTQETKKLLRRKSGTATSSPM